MKMPWSPASDEEKLNDLMAYTPAATPPQTPINDKPVMASPTLSTGVDYCQWSTGANDSYRPSGPRREKLPSGVYVVAVDEMGPFFIRTKVVTDNLIELDDAATNRVLSSIRKFWKSRDKYTKRGVLYKRGLLLWGPAGSGKTATLTLLMNDLLTMGGLVFICQNPSLLGSMLAVLRRIEPDRNLIIVLEDIDELVSRHGEHDLLALLDGETQIDNVVSIACPAPETRILMADLTWVRADQLKEGDEVIAFDENGPQRKFRTAEVNSCPRLQKERYEVVTTKGSIIVSKEHPFLVKLSTGRWHQWIMAKDLKAGQQIAFVSAPWSIDETHDGGYLAGQYDGEGSLAFSRNQHGSLSFRMLWDQANGPLVDKMENLLRVRGFKTKKHPKKVSGPNGKTGKRGPYKPQSSLHVTGGKWEQLRLLGSVRPTRLLAHPKLRKAWEGNRLAPKYVKVICVNPKGIGAVIGLDTTTHTFIGEGMLQHNTTNYPERLGARIINRPSRFDERIFVDMPNETSREKYIKHITKNEKIDEATLRDWVKRTKGFSVAHLRELAVAVFCLDQDFDEVLDRLSKMQYQPKPIKEFNKHSIGLTASAMSGFAMPASGGDAGRIG